MTDPANGSSGIGRPAVDPLLHRLLDGRYRLEALLGRGGMGAVYRAQDLRLERPVAVKVLGGSELADEARFAAEVRALAGFAHPNLVKLLDVGEVDHRDYLVMELIDGPTLSQRLAGGALSETEAVTIGTGIAAALAYVHERGVVHRDIKPANILIGPEGNAYLADFGIARLLDTTGLTATGLTVGTPAYLAPEQVLGREIGPAADIYALGLVLIECLTGRRAFEGTPAEVTAMRLQHEPAIAPGVSASWREVIASMTRLRPDRRVSAAEVASAIAAITPGGVAPVTRVVAWDGPGTATVPRPAPASGPGTERFLPGALPMGTAGPGPAGPARTSARKRVPVVLASVVLLAGAGAVLAGFLLAGGLRDRPTSHSAPPQATTALSSHRSTTRPSPTSPPTTRSPAKKPTGVPVQATTGTTDPTSVAKSTAATTTQVTTTTAAATTTQSTSPTTTAATTTTGLGVTTTLSPGPTSSGAAVVTAAQSVQSAVENGVADGNIVPSAGLHLYLQLQPLLSAPSGPGQSTQAFDRLEQTVETDAGDGKITQSGLASLSGPMNSLATAIGTDYVAAASVGPGGAAPLPEHGHGPEVPPGHGQKTPP